MDKRLEIICEKIRDGYTEGVAIVGPTGSAKNRYAIKICQKLCRGYSSLSLTAYPSSLDELYYAVEKGNILVIEGIEFVNDQLLDEIYKILFTVSPGQKFLVPAAPGAEILFGTKPIYITKHENFKCILLLNSEYLSMLNKETGPMNYLLSIIHRYPVFMAPYVPRFNQSEKDRIIGTVYETNKEKIKTLEENNKMEYKIVLGTGRNSTLPEVEKVYVNKKDGITLLKFSNGDKVRVVREKDDTDDLEKAIAIAMVKYAYGLDRYLTACNKVVDSTKKEKEKKKPVRKPRPKKPAKAPLTEEEIAQIANKFSPKGSRGISMEGDE